MVSMHLPREDKNYSSGCAIYKSITFSWQKVFEFDVDYYQFFNERFHQFAHYQR